MYSLLGSKKTQNTFGDLAVQRRSAFSGIQGSVDSGQLVVFSSDKLLWYNVGEYDHIIHSSKRSEVRPHVPNNKPAAFYRSVGK